LGINQKKGAEAKSSDKGVEEIP